MNKRELTSEKARSQQLSSPDSPPKSRLSTQIPEPPLLAFLRREAKCTNSNKAQKLEILFRADASPRLVDCLLKIFVLRVTRAARRSHLTLLLPDKATADASRREQIFFA